MTLGATTVFPTPAESGDGATPEAAPPTKFFFDPVRSELAGESRTAVDRLAAYLEANPDVCIKVFGYADGWGSARPSSPSAEPGPARL